MYKRGNILLFLLFMTCIMGGWKTSDFVETKHLREDACNRTFSMLYAQDQVAEYGFSTDCFDLEEACRYTDEIKNAIEKINDYLQSAGYNRTDEKLRIFVMEKCSDLYQVPDGVTVNLTKEELSSHEFPYEILRTVTGAKSNALLYGLYKEIFGSEYDNEEISEYLKKEENREMLDLFFGRILPECSDEEQIKMFKQILASLAHYGIEQKGVKGYLENFEQDLLNDWLDFIGNVPQVEDERAEWMTKLDFQRDTGYWMVIKDGSVEYLFDDCVDYLKKVGGAAHLIYSELNERYHIEDFYKEKGVDLGEKGFPESIIYTISCDTGLSYAQNLDSSVRIAIHAPQASVMMHELAHTLQREGKFEKLWMKEGFADYFSFGIYTSIFTREAAYNLITGTEENLLPSELELKEYYLNRCSKPEKPEDVEMIQYANFYIYENRFHKERFNGNGAPRAYQPISDIYGDKFDGEERELSYWEAMSLVDYLIKKYSFKTTWDFMCSDQTYEEAFGKSYSSLKIAWEISLKPSYHKLLKK